MKIGGDSLQTSSWSQMIQVFWFFIYLFLWQSFPFCINILTCIILQLNFLKHFLGGGFIKHIQVGFLLAFFISKILILVKSLSFQWLIYHFSFTLLLLWRIRKMSSFKMYLISNQREDILITMNIGCLVVRRLVSMTDCVSLSFLLLNVLLSVGYSLMLYTFFSCFLPLCADLQHSPSCRECLSLQIQFRTRLGPNYLISNGCYLRLVSLPYEDH